MKPSDGLWPDERPAARDLGQVFHLSADELDDLDDPSDGPGQTGVVLLPSLAGEPLAGDARPPSRRVDFVDTEGRPWVVVGLPVARRAFLRSLRM